MSSENDLDIALKTLKQMFVLNTETIDEILNTQKMDARERTLWVYLRSMIIHLETTIKVETILLDDYIITNHWLDMFYHWFEEWTTDLNKAVGKIPRLERDLKRLKKKKDQMKLLVEKKYKEAFDLITQQIEESEKAQQHYVA